MNTRYTRIALAVASAGLAMSAHAQTAGKPPAAGAPTQLPPVVVTGNPLGSDLFDLAPPVSVLHGQDLFLLRRSTLGETLNELPGVSSSYFGPNASRPVIRGMSDERVRIMQNGTGSLDVSSLSNDHAVTIDPLVVERVEVVRGPATLFYGGNAIGGVVNVIDNRIPTAPIEGATGRVEARFGGAEREKAAAGLFELGHGHFALHADLHTRDTDDLKIKGPNVSSRLQALDPTRPVVIGTLPNSASHSNGGALGSSYVWNNGYLGASYGSFNSQYGTVAEPNVKIDMESTRWDIAGEARELGTMITGLKFKYGRTDYRHTELDAGEPQTTFTNKGYDSRVELTHGALGPLKGAIGVQLINFDFTATGAEAFSPSTSTDAKAAFIYEELPIGKLKLTFGGRYEKNKVRSDGGGPLNPDFGTPRFGAPQELSFNASSGAIGAVYSITQGIALVANGSYNERAPAYFELFANGPHAATGQFEVGNPTFTKEKSKALDVALRMRSGPHSGSIGYFQSRIDNYIALFNTGVTRDSEGRSDDPALGTTVTNCGDGTSVESGCTAEILPEAMFRAVPARFRGFEAEGRFRVLERSGTLDVLAKFDYVRAEDKSTGLPLPRIAPRRYGLGLDYRYAQFGARLDATWVDDQNRVSANELPTDGYTMVNAALTYRVKLPVFHQQSFAEFFLRGTNLLNEEARNHVSIIKDIAPLGRRAVIVGVRGNF